MKNIDNTFKNKIDSLAKNNLSDASSKRLGRDLTTGIIAILCICVGLIYSAVFPDKKLIPSIIYTVAFLVEGIPILITGLKGLFKRNPSNEMELLVSIAILACYFNGNLILSSVIPLILNAAHILEERSILGGREIIDGLKRMQQDTATMVSDDGSEKVVDAKTLRIGQRIVVKPGEIIPIDGVVIKGESDIDQKSLTGESKPFHAEPGNNVYASTINLDGNLIIEVTKEYKDTSFSKILSMLEKSENITNSDTSIMNKFLKYYIPFVLAVAAISGFVTKNVNVFIAVLVSSCPCGHMLVSSAPMIAALSVATKRGILIKNSKFIEELSEVSTVVFDKTGTITEGSFSLREVIPFGEHMEEEVLKISHSMASTSNHHVSRALLSSDSGIKADVEIMSSQELSGRGIKATLKDGRICLFGNRRLLCENGIEVPEENEESVSISYIALDNECLGKLIFEDKLRDNVKESTEELTESGIDKIMLLTGDRKTSAEIAGQKAGITQVCSELLPEDKLRIIEDLKKNECVVFVGDGINDAPALKSSNVGIAMGAMGSDVAIESSDIALMNNNLENIPYVIKLSKSTRKIIYQNMIASIIVSFIMIALSAFSIISSVIAAILHNVGAFIVLINSARIRK